MAIVNDRSDFQFILNWCFHRRHLEMLSFFSFTQYVQTCSGSCWWHCDSLQCENWEVCVCVCGASGSLCLCSVVCMCQFSFKYLTLLKCVYRGFPLDYLYIFDSWWKPNFHFRTKTNSRWFILDVYRCIMIYSLYTIEHIERPPVRPTDRLANRSNINANENEEIVCINQNACVFIVVVVVVVVVVVIL